MWQDYAIMLIQVGFTLALLPAVFGTEKPSRLVCTLNAGLLYVLGAVFATLALWFAAGTSAAVAFLWSVLVIQRRDGR